MNGEIGHMKMEIKEKIMEISQLQKDMQQKTIKTLLLVGYILSRL